MIPKPKLNQKSRSVPLWSMGNSNSTPKLTQPSKRKDTQKIHHSARDTNAGVLMESHYTGPGSRFHPKANENRSISCCSNSARSSYVSSFAQEQDRIPFKLHRSHSKRIHGKPLTYADSNILPLDQRNPKFLAPKPLDFSAILKQNRGLSEIIQKNLNTYSNNANASLLSQKVQSTMKLTNQLDAGLKTNFKFKKINDPKGFESNGWLQGMDNLQAETDRQELLKRQPAPVIKIIGQIGQAYTSRIPSQYNDGLNLAVNEMSKIG